MVMVVINGRRLEIPNTVQGEIQQPKDQVETPRKEVREDGSSENQWSDSASPGNDL